MTLCLAGNLEISTQVHDLFMYEVRHLQHSPQQIPVGIYCILCHVTFSANSTFS